MSSHSVGFALRQLNRRETVGTFSYLVEARPWRPIRYGSNIGRVPTATFRADETGAAQDGLGRLGST